MDVEKEISYMMIKPRTYVNIEKFIEYFLLDDKVSLDKLKKKAKACKNYNNKIRKEFEECSHEDKMKKISTYKFPEIDDEMIDKYIDI
jgi:hypothetical protein